MRRLIVTCECGERMKVPRSAIGKTGMCPTCGRRMRISGDNSHAAETVSGKSDSVRGVHMGAGRNASPDFGRVTDDAKERFGKAVDLYFNKRYGEALALLASLARQLPGDPDVERARALCMKALRIPTRPALTGGGVSVARLAAPNAEPASSEREKVAEPPETPAASRESIPESEPDPEEPNSEDATPHELSEDAVRAFVLDKMLHGESPDEQMKAAELASRLLGLVDDGDQSAAAPGSLEELQAALRAGRDDDQDDGSSDDSWGGATGVRDVVDL